MAEDISLANQLLIAMPSLKDPNFEKSVIYVCEHNPAGTVGLIINRPMQFPLRLVFDQLKIEPIRVESNQMPLLFGGPMQTERGFVIHRPFGVWRSSLLLHDDVTVTTSNDIIRAIAEDQGPKDVLVAMGFVSWGDNQLNQEVMNNTWLVCPFKPEILFDVPFADRWKFAGSTIGVKMDQLTMGVGHA
ncbi:YqgE/AlgH family protein [bacterium]|nr:YqgE/AlgH family protein [bacterium]